MTSINRAIALHRRLEEASKDGALSVRLAADFAEHAQPTGPVARELAVACIEAARLWLSTGEGRDKAVNARKHGKDAARVLYAQGSVRNAGALNAAVAAVSGVVSEDYRGFAADDAASDARSAFADDPDAHLAELEWQIRHLDEVLESLK